MLYPKACPYQEPSPSQAKQKNSRPLKTDGGAEAA